MNEEQNKEVAGLVRGLIEGEEHETAIALARATVEQSPDAELFSLLGVAYAKRGLADHAIDAFERSLRIVPDDIITLTALAEAHIERCDYEAAGSWLQLACELDPNAEHPQGKRARILIARARKELKAAST